MNHRRRRTQEQLVFSVAHSSVAVLLHAIKGKGINALSEALLLMAGFITSGLESKNS